MKVAAVIGQEASPGLVGQDHAEARDGLPIGVGGSRLERLQLGRDRLAVLVDHVGVGQLVLLGIGILDIADRALGLDHVVGHAFVALGADADRPLDRGVGTDLILPSGAHLVQVVGEVEGGARSVGAVHDGDRLGRKLRLRIELLDRLIIPFGDLAEEDLGERRPVEHDLAGLDAFDIDDGNDAAHDHRELDQAVVSQLLLAERLVGGAERHRLGFDLLDAAARADRLIVEPDARLFLVGVGPFRIDRIGEGRAGTRNIGCLGRGDGERCGQAHSCRIRHNPHFRSPLGWR